MRTANTRVLSALLAIGAGACNPSSFNSVLDKAPVSAFSVSGSGTGPLFALPLPAPVPSTKVAARMLVSRQDNQYLAVADYDKVGKVTLHEASDASNSLGSWVNSMAMRADGTILLGTPSYNPAGSSAPAGKVSTLSLGTQPDGTVSFAIQPLIQGGGVALTRLGISVATGNVTGQVGGDSVVVGDNSVQVILVDKSTGNKSSIDTDAKCQQYISLGSPTDVNAFRPVVVADLLGSDGADEIVLSGPLNGASYVLFLNAPTGAIALACPKVLSLTSTTRFGASLAAGDFDGDGLMDLAVGFPPDQVYVYFGPLDGLTDPLIRDVTITSTTSTAFGKRLSVYQAPGQAAAQLLVSDPLGSAVGQRQSAGKVMLFNISRLQPALSTTDAVATLFDSDQDSSLSVFGGASLGGLEFNCSGAPLPAYVPWVSIGVDVLTFFAYPTGPVSAADPRCFGK